MRLCGPHRGRGRQHRHPQGRREHPAAPAASAPMPHHVRTAPRRSCGSCTEQDDRTAVRDPAVTNQGHFEGTDDHAAAGLAGGHRDEWPGSPGHGRPGHGRTGGALTWRRVGDADTMVFRHRAGRRDPRCSARYWSPTAARSRSAHSVPATNWARAPLPSSPTRTATPCTGSRPTRPTRSASPGIRYGPICPWTRSSAPRSEPVPTPSTRATAFCRRTLGWRAPAPGRASPSSARTPPCWN